MKVSATTREGEGKNYLCKNIILLYSNYDVHGVLVNLLLQAEYNYTTICTDYIIQDIAIIYSIAKYKLLHVKTEFG